MQMLKRPTAKTATGSKTVPPWLAPVALLVLCIGVFFFRLGEAGLINICESFYPASVREMIETNSYVVPQLNYQVYFSKPIMTFWLMAASYKLFGLNDFAGRFSQAVLATLLVMTCFFVARKLKGNLAGFLAGAFLASSPFLLIYTRASSIDAFFSVFMGLSLCALLYVVSGGSKRAWPLLYISLALAVLTKGPAALVLFGGGSVISLVILRPTFSELKSLASRLHLVAGTFLFLAVLLPWWIAVSLSTNGLFPEVFLFYENMRRYLGQVVIRKTIWWRYLAVIAIGLLPWSMYLPAMFIDSFKNRQKDTDSLLDPRIICLCFASVVVAFFSFSSTQMETYVLPACTPLALAAGLSLAGWCKNFSGFSARWMKGVSVALRVIGIGTFIAGLIVPYFLKGLLPWMAFGIPLAGLILAFGFNWQYNLFKSNLREKSLVVMATSMCLFSTLLVPICIEYWYNDTQKEMHELASYLKKTPEQVGVYGHYLPAIMYYTQGPVDCFFNAGQVVPRKPTSKKLYVLAQKLEVEGLTRNPQFHIRPLSVGQKWGLYYVEGGTLIKGAILEEIFKRLSIKEMITLDHQKYGLLTDYYYGGTLNLPERCK